MTPTAVHPLALLCVLCVLLQASFAVHGAVGAAVGAEDVPGGVGNGTQCEECVAGTYTNASTNCGVAAAGPEPNTTRGVNECPAGSCNTSARCTPCPRGFFQPDAGSTNCSQCKVGFIAAQSGSTKCTPCSTGATNNANRSECSLCPPGYMNPFSGSVCTMCAIGMYQPSSGAIRCFECPFGTYGDTPALPFCTPCGKGKYNDVQGSTSRDACKTCPSGSYCPDDNTYQPLPCPKDNYCASGVSVPTECAFLQVSGAGSSSCSRSTSFWIFTTVGTILLIVVVTGVILSVFFYLQRKSAEQVKPKKERLIPEPLSGPVYGGY